MKYIAAVLREVEIDGDEERAMDGGGGHATGMLCGLFR